jgi:hypothetical protein
LRASRRIGEAERDNSVAPPPRHDFARRTDPPARCVSEYTDSLSDSRSVEDADADESSSLDESLSVEEEEDESSSLLEM